MAKGRIITGKEFLLSLGDFLPMNTRRVVIDAAWNGLVMVYVEQVGTEQLLRVMPSLGGIKVQIVGGHENARTHQDRD